MREKYKLLIGVLIGVLISVLIGTVVLFGIFKTSNTDKSSISYSDEYNRIVKAEEKRIEEGPKDTEEYVRYIESKKLKEDFDKIALKWDVFIGASFVILIIILIIYFIIYRDVL